MSTEQRELLIVGITGCLAGVFLSALGIWLFYMASNGTTYAVTLFGITIEGKVLAATVCWGGFVALFYCIRKLTKYLSEKKETK
jgi:hypothetical protein